MKAIIVGRLSKNKGLEKVQIVSKMIHVTSQKMREMREEVGKKTPKKEMDNPSFL